MTLFRTQTSRPPAIIKYARGGTALNHAALVTTTDGLAYSDRSHDTDPGYRILGAAFADALSEPTQ